MGENGGAFHDGLGDQHSVERVAVMVRKPAHQRSMLETDWERGKLALLDRVSEWTRRPKVDLSAGRGSRARAA